MLRPATEQAFEKAAAEYIEAERFNADRPESRSNLAQFLIRRGKTGEAEQEYLAALKLAFSVVPRVDLADLYRTLGREADAELLLRQTISIDPRAAAPRHSLGLALVRAKRYDEALESFKKAVELDPGQARYAYVYAVALKSRGHPVEARTVLEQALQTNPSDVQLLTALLQGALKARDVRQALPYAERLRVLQPDDASIGTLVTQLRDAARRLPPR